MNFLSTDARGGLGEILGHKTMAMVMRYTDLLDAHKKKAIQLLDGLLFRSPCQSTFFMQFPIAHNPIADCLGRHYVDP